MIPPRGCAYIVMTHRQDAYRALQKLSRGSYKVNQKAIKVSKQCSCFLSKHLTTLSNGTICVSVSPQIAWALNKGIKSELKPFWDVELGVTYVPWSKIREVQLEELKEGGVLDVETLAPGTET